MIGVFDSGYGGLTILRALVDTLPQYSYIYFGDNKNAPYGPKYPDEIYELAKAGTDYLFQQGAQLVILGCNTASACALRRLQQEWLPQHYPERRILGIVVPTIEQITGADWRHTESITTPLQKGGVTIGILGTTATIESGVYEMEIHKRNPSVKVVSQACPHLAELIERDAPGREIDKEIQACVQKLLDKTVETPLAVLLGCTHYELIADQIRQYLPVTTHLYQQPSITAASLAAYLKRHPKLEQTITATGSRQFVTTSRSEHISQTASRFFSQAVTFKPI